MTSFYPRLAQEIWQQPRAKSTLTRLAQSELDPQHIHDPAVSTRQRRMTRQSGNEARYDLSQQAVRCYGYRWIKPLGCNKTAAQQEEEAGEMSGASYEAYQDEDGALALDPEEEDGEDILTELEEDEEEQDLDALVEEGASFELEPGTSDVEGDLGDSPSRAQPRSTDGQRRGHRTAEMNSDEGMQSAEEASEHSYGDADEIE